MNAVPLDAGLCESQSAACARSFCLAFRRGARCKRKVSQGVQALGQWPQRPRFRHLGGPGVQQLCIVLERDGEAPVDSHGRQCLIGHLQSVELVPEGEGALQGLGTGLLAMPEPRGGRRRHEGRHALVGPL